MQRGLISAFVLLVSLLAADVARAMTILITVSKPSQRMTVNVDGIDKFVWPVSTGAPGYDTPSGTYRPFRMEVDHFSQQWDNAPMPHSIFFTLIGHAIHGSYHIKTLGQAVSHGCVRISPDNATVLYGMIQKAGMKNTTVVIRGGFFDFGNQAPSFEDLKKKKHGFTLFGAG
jgi:lipoprotein-anchoring transpeptidase ErfK/SrfK